MRVSSPFLKVIQQLPTSSSLSSCHLYPPLYLSFSNPLQKAVSTQNVTNPVRLPFTYFMQDIPLLLESKQYILISHVISPTDLFHPPPAPHFKTFQVFLIEIIFSILCTPCVFAESCAAECSAFLTRRHTSETTNCNSTLILCSTVRQCLPALIMLPDMMLVYKHPISGVPGRWLLVMYCAVSFGGLCDGW